MSMTKREIAIASVVFAGDDMISPGLAGYVVDQLIHDGIISLGYAGDPDVSAVVDAFQIAMKTTATIKTDRYAASRLAKRFGLPTVVGTIQMLGERSREKYAPTVNNLTQLEQKWPSIQRFVSTRNEDEPDV